MKKVLLLLSIISISIVSISQTLTVKISENQFGIDENHLLIVSHINDIETYNNTTEYSKIEIELDETIYYFDTIPVNLKYSSSYIVTQSDTSRKYTLYFTQLPIIVVESTDSIIDDPKVLANLVYSDEEQVLISNVGIEIRGGSSQSYPKKNYDLEFWEDSTGNETNSVQFGNLRSDDDWILNGLYNEPLRIRSYTANKLWREMHIPNYIDDEPKAKSGIDVKYVEMFLNGQYNGLYNLTEQVDKKRLKLKSFKDDEIRGELYKGVSHGEGVLFSNLPNYDNDSRLWGGYEMKFPKDDEITDWNNVYTFTDFVINSTDSNFTKDIWSKFDFINYSDYFIFLNLIRAQDNNGKNTYLARYNADEPYFYVPWDLDGCFGTIWTGERQNITDDILKNGLITRVINLNPTSIVSSTSARWSNLRESILEKDVLSSSITAQYNFFKDNKIYERETIVYQNYSFGQEELSYTLTWLEDRLDYLDTYFEDPLSINENRSLNETHFIYPNLAKDKIYIDNVNTLISKEFKIYNNSGQVITKGILKDNFISIKSLEKGFYIIRFKNYSDKFIKR